jgi:AraC-like DNA-binding protein
VPSQSTDIGLLRFSTTAMPERERVPFWREVFGREVVRADIEPPANAPFEATATLRAWPGLRSMSCTSTAARTRRTRDLVADGDDGFVLLIGTGGTVTASQLGRDVTLRPGEATAILHAEPAAMIHARFRHEGLVMARTAVAPLVADFEGMAMRPIPRDHEALRLLTSYLAIMRDDRAMTPELRRLAATHVHDLVAMAIGATRDGAAIAKERGVQAARLAAVKADIMARAGDHDLTLAAVAARHRISPRSVQLLFEREDRTFSQFVLDVRLAHAHRMLADPRHAVATVSAIAWASGFGDLSHFNRSFRRRYGATPSETRAESKRGGN